MTAYPPQQPVRKLTRSRSNRMLGGVCAGVANYLNMDVTLVRILTVVLSLFTGIPIVAYIVMLLVVPEEDLPPYVDPQTVRSPDSATRADSTTQASASPTSPPTDQPAAPADPVWGAEGAPWDRAPSSAGDSSDQGPSTPTADPGPAPRDPLVPNEAAPVPDPEPLPEDEPAHPAAGEASAWESAPADPEKPQNEAPEDEKSHETATEDEKSEGENTDGGTSQDGRPGS